MSFRKKKKKKVVKVPKVGTYRPPAKSETSFIRVLKNWSAITLPIENNEHFMVDAAFIVSPENKVYRRAAAWEKPTLVIDSDILPPEHHIRLIYVRDKPTRIHVKKQLRRRKRRFGN